MPIDKIKAGVNKMIKPKNLGHYWKLKMDWELMFREVIKRANELENEEYAWSRSKFFQSGNPYRQEKANEVRALGLDLARLQGKTAKLRAILEAFENSLPKESLPKNRYRKISGQHLPIEIDGGMGDDKG